MELTERQHKFIRAYIENGGNRTKAAITAGYSPKGASVEGSRQYGKVKIREEIVEQRKEILASIGVTFESNAAMLKKLAEACMDGTKLNKEGFIHPVGVYQSIDMLNKMGDFYAAEKHDVKSTNIDMELLEKYEKDI